MPDVPDVAAEYLRAELQLRRFGRLRLTIDMALGTGFLAPYYLVVLRLDTGAEIIRMKADLTDANHLLGQVELDLETKTVAEFLEEWRPA
ncbi:MULTISPECIES: hypothetical protein [unclassified Rathayibacter]|jgi:hypothetical protein|uniref:hypothetical protein n=1 Tax=unclassified Rathayibacter TaxID=2609250 RepID=UPI000CE728CB|nr:MULTISPECIES: hypothetical protein [unclassified Rathayibacter]PPF47544.1 hypothetical protein C5E14_09845 [Rathayibacter sp. AY1A1]PPH03119.1 hypothetical protein C5C32_00880 [Rathayibacter sp. AY1G9]